jgi:hypothetical protein
LHIVSDEDLTNNENTQKLYKFLNKTSQYSLVIASIKGNDGYIYKDATYQKNKYLIDLMGEVSHIGSAILNIDLWDDDSFNLLNKYCKKPGNIRVLNAAAIISCISNIKIAYFAEHIVEMGKINKQGEIRGYFVYGFFSLLDQYFSILELVRKIKIKKKLLIISNIFYYFSHHALQDSHRKFSENEFNVALKFIQKNKLNLLQYIFFSILLLMYFYYKFYFKFRIRVTSYLRRVQILK